MGIAQDREQRGERIECLQYRRVRAGRLAERSGGPAGFAPSHDQACSRRAPFSSEGLASPRTSLQVGGNILSVDCWSSGSLAELDFGLEYSRSQVVG